MNSPFLSRYYYGWVITGTLAITETVSWGILYYAFSALLAPMRDDLGWSVSTLTGGFSLALIVMGIVAPAVGIWLDRHGPRLLMTGASILGTLMVVAWSRVNDVWLYYLIWIGMGLAMSGALYEPAFTSITAWFERDRSRAILIITIMAGFASTIFLPLSGWFEENVGVARSAARTRGDPRCGDDLAPRTGLAPAARRPRVAHRRPDRRNGFGARGG
ncbi:MAG: MFS transporter [Thermomicrobiales bacterium]